MAVSKIFFTNTRCRVGTSLLHKMDKLVRQAGIERIDFNRKYVAIKVHFGEPGNLSFVRPNYAKTLVDLVKSLGGKPFLTDCNTLYVGRRNNALAHLDAAYENGFSPFSTGCHVLVGDGLKGTDDLEVPVNGGMLIKNAKIGRAVMDADVLISLNHFKGHEMTGFGGAIKNVGMGCGSRAGKMEMHSDAEPQVSEKRCAGCRTCVKYCAQGAISFKENKAVIDQKLCVGCGRCIGVCNFHAIAPKLYNNGETVSRKMVEYAKAVVDGRPGFHINIVTQVSPCCDCHGENDAAVVPDIGIFAGFDMVALDKACIDAVNAAPAISSSVLGDKDAHSRDHFCRIHPGVDWRPQIAHAEAIGLGSGEYELVSLDCA
ncbi:MAG: DUF362 domain-containing protein [Deltaproteobacteria bacterium]|jgi:uncharacterized Fe-S center protein|nr:DUF362 domain-containing protein [Deltaproteobacteria bacterium]